MSLAQPIEDIQSGRAARALPINQVGIAALKLPLLSVADGQKMPAVGEWSCYTDLRADVRGTHMSRLVRVLHDGGLEMDFAAFCDLPKKVLSRLPANRCLLTLRFTHFLNKTAPVSGECGYIDCKTTFFADYQKSDNGARYLARIVVPVTSLCPCSKVISRYGAHNQRSNVILTIEPAGAVSLAKMIAMAEDASSCELFSVLKRPDERHVTEHAFDNPKFVEDIVRELAAALQDRQMARHYRVEAENFESIHNHSAYAMIESDGFPVHLLVK